MFQCGLLADGRRPLLSCIPLSLGHHFLMVQGETSIAEAARHYDLHSGGDQNWHDQFWPLVLGKSEW